MGYNHKYFTPDGSAVQSGKWSHRLVTAILWCFATSQLAIYIWSLAVAEWQLTSLRANPTLGVSRDNLMHVGATATDKIRKEHQWWRLASSPFVPAGAIHLWANCSLFWTFGGFLASALGPWQLLVILVLSGAAGSSVSANIATQFVTAAAGAPAFGLVGGTAAALLLHRQLFQHHLISGVLLGLVLLVNLFIGATPFVDNSANCAGFVAGALATAGCLLVERRGIAGREWVLRVCAMLCLAASLAITVVAVLGLALALPAANCCDRWVCTPNRLWDCGASRIPSCEYEVRASALAKPPNVDVGMTCSVDGQVFNFTGVYSDQQLQQQCNMYCGSKYRQ